MTEILYQIALIVVIIAGLILIALLVRAYQILGSVDDSSKIVNRRLHDLDAVVSSLQSYASNTVETLKYFTTTMDAVKRFFDKNKKEKKEKDE